MALSNAERQARYKRRLKAAASASTIELALKLRNSTEDDVTEAIKGSYVEVVDAISGFWLLSGNLLCSGTEATPFSAAV